MCQKELPRNESKQQQPEKRTAQFPELLAPEIELVESAFVGFAAELIKQQQSETAHSLIGGHRWPQSSYVPEGTAVELI